MQQHRNVLFVILVFLALPSLAQRKTEAIRLNQVGFYPDGPKMAIVVDSAADQFFVLTPDRQDTVFTGFLSSARTWQYSSESVRQADFSELRVTGRFVLLVPDLGVSAPFDIKPRVLQEVARSTIKGYYFQRMSIDLTEEFAGTWSRPMGHPDRQVLVHSSAATLQRPEGTRIACPRGWYDAGDYNKYIVNSGISVYTLLALYEHFPVYSQALETHIPESSDAIPDVLDEALWNIRWMLTMQDPFDGGVYHKCTEANFSGTVMPHEATAPRYVVQKSSTAALDFAAVMAQSARVFRAFESELPGLADSCLTAALSAWRWARRHPHVYYRQDENNRKYLPAITTGEYGDRDDSDEFKWAAAELYITTKQDSFIAAVNPLSDNDTSVPGWQSVETLAFYSLAHHRKNLTAAVDTTALRNRLLQFANAIRAELSRSAYRVLINGFWWGSNSGAANQSIAMIQAFELTADSSYLDAAIANLDYLLGRNATTYCFVTGEGDKPPMHPHHRPSEADDVIDPIPGLLVGGPNPGQQDGCAGYPSDLPARSYLDSYCSYASNEICINWNAPIAYAAAAVEAIKSPTGKPNAIRVEITSPGEGDSFDSSQIIPISAEAAIADGKIVQVEFYANAIKIGETVDAPFVFQWAEARPGVYRLQAKAVGDRGDFRYSEEVTVIVFNAESGGDLLFIVGSLDLNAGDRAIRDFLVQNDYHVLLQHDDDSAFAIADVDAILLSSTCGASRKIRAELVNINVPLLSWEYSLFDDFNWTGRRNNTDYGKQIGSRIEIVNSSHPLAAGLSGRTEVTAVEHELLWAMPGANATTIACLENDARPVLFCYETGSVMLNDMTAKSRQIGLYYSDESPAAFTENSWKILLAAVEWARAGERLNVEERSSAPHSHQLWQNYPNPFNPETQIRYALSEPAAVTIVIYNAMGQRIATLVQARQAPGEHRVSWNGRDENGTLVSAGIYLWQMIAGDFERTHKMILLR